MSRDRRHRASYDAEGNIVIQADEEEAVRVPVHQAEPQAEDEALLDEEVLIVASEESASDEMRCEPDVVDPWSIPIDEDALRIDPEDPEERAIAERSRAVTRRLASVSKRTRGAMDEGIRQYRRSIAATAPLALSLGNEAGFSLRRLWGFLTQPVWIPARQNKVKEYSRGTLFLIDIVRFGGTFAGIFIVLFLALNYQSFYEIAKSGIDSFVSSPSLDSPESAVDNALLQSLKSNDLAQPGRNQGDLFSYLPTVGPPDNRIIIPRLKLNVPLVEPPFEALLRQDWNQVESDIQHSLQSGVVHYPGTAKPGQAGNFFVTGHSSYYPWDPGQYKTVFARLHELNPGDEYWVYFGGDKHRYIVRSKREVNPADTSVLDQPPTQRISTLMTCTPVGTTLRRLIIQAEEVDPVSGIVLKVGERSGDEVVPKVSLDALPI